MNEQNTNTDQQQSTQQGAPTQPEENGNAEKMFTQDDVDRIIKQRLNEKRMKVAEVEAREADLKGKESDLQAREADLSTREAAFQAAQSRYECQKHLEHMRYPLELLDELDTSDVDTFKQQAYRLATAFANRPQRKAPPMRNPDADEKSSFYDVDSAFRDAKHTPKKYELYGD